MLFSLKFAAKITLGFSAAVKMTIFGRVISVTPMGNVMVIQATHVDASMPFLLMDNTASLLINTVSWFSGLFTFRIIFLFSASPVTCLHALMFKKLFIFLILPVLQHLFSPSV